MKQQALKKIIFPLAAIISCILFAATHAAHKPEDATVKHPRTQVIIYAEPDMQAKRLGKVDPWQHLIPYYHKEGKPDWVKVASPATGIAGWINKDQYFKALRSMAQRHKQTFIIDSVVAPSSDDSKAMRQSAKQKKTSQNGETHVERVYVQVIPQGDDKTKIVAFRNGKKLSDKEAQAEMKTIQAQQKQIAKENAAIQQSIRQAFDRFTQEPIIIMPPPADGNDS